MSFTHHDLKFYDFQGIRSTNHLNSEGQNQPCLSGEHIN